jgi:DNA-binding NarL/FixJ family response regulator
LIGVVIVADIRLYREGVAEFLGADASIAVVVVVADWPQSLVPLPGHEPDVVPLDMAMPDSVLALRSLAAAEPAVKRRGRGLALGERRDRVRGGGAPQ